MTDQENLQVQQILFDIYSGILFNNQTFADSGEKAEITYDFTCPEYTASMGSPARARPLSGASG